MDGSFEEIHKYLSQGEILAQLAEECIELAQAALKLRRALDGATGSPVSCADTVTGGRKE